MVPKTLRPSKPNVAAERDGGCSLNLHCESRCSRSPRAIHVSGVQTCPHSTTWRSCRWMYHTCMGWPKTRWPKDTSIICRARAATSLFLRLFFQNVKLEERTFSIASWFAVAAIWEWSSWRLGCFETRSCRMIHIGFTWQATCYLMFEFSNHDSSEKGPISVRRTHFASQLSTKPYYISILSSPRNPLLNVYFQSEPFLVEAWWCSVAIESHDLLLPGETGECVSQSRFQYTMGFWHS